MLSVMMLAADLGKVLAVSLKGGGVLQQEILALGRHTVRTLHLQWVAEEPTAVYDVYSQSH